MKTGGSLEHVHEYIKIRMSLFEEKNNAKFEELAIQALEKDKNNKVASVANLLRRVKKSGLSGD